MLFGFARSVFVGEIESIPKMLAGVVIGLIGAGHLGGGTLLLLRDRVWLNNRTGTMLKVSGWLGIVRRTYALDSYDHVEIVNSKQRWWTRNAPYAVAITGQDVSPLILAHAALKPTALMMRSEIETHLVGLLEPKRTNNPMDRSGGSAAS